MPHYPSSSLILNGKRGNGLTTKEIEALNNHEKMWKKFMGHPITQPLFLATVQKQKFPHKSCFMLRLCKSNFWK